jgi:hypothetical protein
LKYLVAQALGSLAGLVAENALAAATYAGFGGACISAASGSDILIKAQAADSTPTIWNVTIIVKKL